MRKAFPILLIIILAGCARMQNSPTFAPTGTPLVSTPSLDPVTPTFSSTPEATASAAPEDFFTQMAISLPAPTCNGLTQSQTEGPYYKPDTPERTSLLEDGMDGTHLIVVGYVLDQNCQPLSNAWLDFWQADASGQYDNIGYRLRGHQFTDARGRYHLETILPGLYASRPVEHIHVKVRPKGGDELTSQLYFSQQPVDGLTVTPEERGTYLLGYFNFVVQQ